MLAASASEAWQRGGGLALLTILSSDTYVRSTNYIFSGPGRSHELSLLVLNHLLLQPNL